VTDGFLLDCFLVLTAKATGDTRQIRNRTNARRVRPQPIGLLWGIAYVVFGPDVRPHLWARRDGLPRAHLQECRHGKLGDQAQARQIILAVVPGAMT
jgi:hypothetical protein